MDPHFVQAQTSFYPTQTSGVSSGRPIRARPGPQCRSQFHVGGFPLTANIAPDHFKSLKAPTIFAEKFEDRFWRGEEAEKKIRQTNTPSQPQQTVHTSVNSQITRPEPRYSAQPHVQKRAAPMDSQPIRVGLDVYYDPQGIWARRY